MGNHRHKCDIGGINQNICRHIRKPGGHQYQAYIIKAESCPESQMHIFQADIPLLLYKTSCYPSTIVHTTVDHCFKGQ